MGKILCWWLYIRCPYDHIDWKDSIYDVSLDSDARASYFRYFRKHGIKTHKRYNNIPILDIIDNVSYVSIVEYYIATGKYKEYLPQDLDPEYTFDISYQPTNDSIQRLIEVGYVKHVSFGFYAKLTENMAKIFCANGIKVAICNHDFLSLCIATEYDIINLDNECMDISYIYKYINNIVS